MSEKLYKDLRNFDKKIDKSVVFNTTEKDTTNRHELFMDQRKEYGFDERETWCLGFTSILWLYAHLKRYREWGSCVEMDDPNYAHTYEIERIKKDKDGKYIYKKIEYPPDSYQYPEAKFEKETVILPYGVIIDLICEYFEYYIKNEDDWEINVLTEGLAKEGLRLYSQILSSLWW